jgi:hypothetical protein
MKDYIPNIGLGGSAGFSPNGIQSEFSALI